VNGEWENLNTGKAKRKMGVWIKGEKTVKCKLQNVKY
jgi:hypothetical protein